MLEVSTALGVVNGKIHPLESETVRIENSFGRVLREDIRADMDLPPFHRSQMDGFAVIDTDIQETPAYLTVAGESSAGNGWHEHVTAGSAIRIMTGAPVPDGCNTVVKVELTEEDADRGTVKILESVPRGNAIVTRGSEMKSGSVVIQSGVRITGSTIAPVAAFGYAEVAVGIRPRVHILGTGSEIVDIGATPDRDHIRNSNSIMLAALCTEAGALATIGPIVRDDPDQLRSSISKAAAESEIVVLTGGVSVGKYDHTKNVLRELGAEIFFEKIRLKPGKPMVFGRLGSTFVFALPGNPASAMVTYHLFVRKAILLMQGASNAELRTAAAIAASPVRAAKERETYLPASLKCDGPGHLIADPLASKGSSDLVAFSKADTLIHLAAGQSVSAGEPVNIVFLQ